MHAVWGVNTGVMRIESVFIADSVYGVRNYQAPEKEISACIPVLLSWSNNS